MNLYYLKLDGNYIGVTARNEIDDRTGSSSIWHRLNVISPIKPDRPLWCNLEGYVKSIVEEIKSTVERAKNTPLDTWGERRFVCTLNHDYNKPFLRDLVSLILETNPDNYSLEIVKL